MRGKDLSDRSRLIWSVFGRGTRSPNDPVFAGQPRLAKLQLDRLASFACVPLPSVGVWDLLQSEWPANTMNWTFTEGFNKANERQTEPIDKKKPNVAALLSIYWDSVGRAPLGPVPPLHNIPMTRVKGRDRHHGEKIVIRLLESPYQDVP